MIDLPADPADWTPQELAFALALEASELKAEQVCVLDVGELLFVTDYFVLCTTRSTRQTRSLAESLNDLAKKAVGNKGRIEGSQRSSWMLMDLGNVVVHVLTEEAREFYALDSLWEDADRYEISADGDEQASENAGDKASTPVEDESTELVEEGGSEFAEN